MGSESSNRNDHPLSRVDVDRKISELRAFHIPPRTSEEHLDLPLDERIRVDESPGRSKLVLVVDDTDVSWTTIVDFTQQVGRSTVRMGGIAGVGTHDKHRFKGYSRCVLENCLRWMVQQGYHTTMLYGIPSYYPKFGYAKAFPAVRFSVAVRDAETASAGPFEFVDFDPDRHADALLAMYTQTNRHRTGVTRRDPDTWRTFRKGMSWNSKAEARIAVGPDGEPQGYLVFDDKPLTANVIETGYLTPKVFPALLRRAASRAWSQRLEAISFHLPEDDLFMDFCRGYGVNRHTVFPRDGGGMVRLIRLRETLESVTEELATRVSGSGAVTLQTNLGDVTLRWNAGGLTVGDADSSAPTVSLPQWALAQLLYGYRAVPTLVAEGSIKGDSDALNSLNELFPIRPHFQYAADHF